MQLAACDRGLRQTNHRRLQQVAARPQTGGPQAVGSPCRVTLLPRSGPMSILLATEYASRVDPMERNPYDMRPSRYVRPTVSAPPAMPPQLMPQPPIAPVTPPVHVVDLMTTDGSAAFGARWKGIEAKIVACPALSDS